MASILQLHNKSAIKTAIPTKIHLQITQRTDIGDVVDCVPDSVQDKGKTVVGKVVVVNLPESEVQSYSFVKW